ncbi:MAG: protein phosphatase 2C domain-containing protein [Planctomycetes bacterium]|nr:protein phosphatase 2C domain-containing protein [Planctomycetota bacterium]
MNNRAACPTFVLHCAHVSDLGMRRLNNQDAVAVVITDDPDTWAARGHLLMVADGMGAHAAGELASKLAVDNIPHTYFKLRDLLPPAALRQAIRDANAVVYAKGQSNIGFQGMGTTCSCLVLLPQGALVAHIGDSRVYRLHGAVLEQLTFDHSLVWEMAAASRMAEEDLPSFIPKNVITRSLGPHPTVNVDLEGPYHIAAGDVLLLCSDGLSGQVSDEEIGAILGCLPPDEAVKSFVDLANLRGGPDNISIIVAQVAGSGLPEEATVSETSVDPPGDRRSQLLTAAWWLAAGASLGVLAYGLANRFWAGAVAALMTFIGSLVGAKVCRQQPATTRLPPGMIGGPYGNGPYRKADCAPNRQVVDALAEVADQLRGLTESETNDRSIHWQVFDEARQQATAAADAGDFATAIRHHCRSMRDVMQQLADHNAT